MKQLVFIHGGETFDTYEAYLDALKNEYVYDPEDEKGKTKRWKNSLAEKLGDKWDVHLPQMPSKFNAKYLEWSIWFEKVIPYLRDEIILIGHSLGGIFLAKYLAEHELPIRVKATFLIAAPFDTRDTDYTLSDFTLSALEPLTKHAGKLYLYHSKDDPVVPFSAFEAYRELLPTATTRVFEDRGHFMQESLPEILEDIRSLD
ncbi:MAG: hypothetical protein JWO84_535 [Parcubacteria group bacterium]|nr:hypothetical protein [Parcubacteria group bacterium]